MRRLLLALTIFLLFPSFAPPATAGQKSPTNRPQQTPAGASSDKPDELQRQYIFKYIDIYSELRSAHNKLALIRHLEPLQEEQERVELRSRGRVPVDVKKEGAKLQADREATEIRIKDLQSQREALKLDALKFYNGKLPKWLSDSWSQCDKDYAVFIQDYLEKLGKDIEDRQGY